MRVLALDLGARRIGLAVSDSEGSVAFPAGFLERRDLRSDLEALAKLARERDIARVVVGLPLHMNGQAGEEATRARRFAEQLAAHTGLSVDLLDERWTTRQAERSLREGRRGTARRRGRGAVDALAATLLLQTYLDRQASGAREPVP